MGILGRLFGAKASAAPDEGRPITQSNWTTRGNITTGKVPYGLAQVGAASTSTVALMDVRNSPVSERYGQVLGGGVPSDAPLSVQRWRTGLSGAQVSDPRGFLAYAPTVIEVEQDPAIWTAGGGTLVGLTGSPSHPGQLAEHGPIKRDTERGGRTWWRWGRPTTPSDQIQLQTGVGETGVRRASPMAISPTNAFQLPNPRQTWDNPAYMPGAKLDRDGKPIVGKAGYPLTPTALEGSPYTVHNDRKMLINEGNPNDFTDRVRAGVAEPWQARPAQMPLWYFTRPFDKIMTDVNVGWKGITRSPQVSWPTRNRIERNLAGNSVDINPGVPRTTNPPAGMSPLGNTPNTERVIPPAWDSNMYVQPSPGSVVQTAQPRFRVGLR